MTWNYRVLKKDYDNDYTEYRLVEMYYDENGKPDGWCEPFLMSETPDGIYDVLRMALKDIENKPIINANNLVEYGAFDD